jgi:hypothetical protein
LVLIVPRVTHQEGMFVDAWSIIETSATIPLTAIKVNRVREEEEFTVFSPQSSVCPL